MGKRIIFTGGSGKAGRHVIPYLLSRGHKVLNLDIVPLSHSEVNTLVTDLTDSGETFNAMSTYFGFEELKAGKGIAPVDAVVHFAAIPRILLRPDNVMFSSNVVSTYNVIEAATKLGIRKIIIASSETIYGVCFAEGDRDFLQFPLEEDYDVDPMDSYGLSKLVGEKTARAFASRTGADIYALRIGGLIEPDEYHRFHGFIDDPSLRRRDAWTYIDARDLGQIVHLCVQRDGLGFQVFNSVNNEIIANEPTTAFLAKHAPNTRITREMGTFEGPLSNRKAREVLGFKEEHNWRKYLTKT